MTIILIPHREIAGESLAQIFTRLEEAMQPKYGVTMFEATIISPRLDGSTWEIRNLVQNGLVRAQYAKIGADDVVGNVAAGGHAADALATVEAAYRIMFAGKSHSALAQTFLKEAAEYAEQIAKVLSRHFTAVRKEFLPEYPFAEIAVSDICVDFMAQSVEERMVPVAVDINFRPLTEGLRTIDPIKHAEVALRSLSISLRFLQQTAGYASAV